MLKTQKEHNEQLKTLGRKEKRIKELDAKLAQESNNLEKYKDRRKIMAEENKRLTEQLGLLKGELAYLENRVLPDQRLQDKLDELQQSMSQCMQQEKGIKAQIRG